MKTRNIVVLGKDMYLMSYEMALLRTIIKYLFLPVSFIMLIFTNNGYTIHELLFKSKVVYFYDLIPSLKHTIEQKAD